MQKQFLMFLSACFLIGCAQIKEKLVLNKNEAPDRFINIWTKNLDPKYKDGNLPIGQSSPLVLGDAVFIGDLAGRVSKYKKTSGRLIWRETEKAGVRGTPVAYGKNIIYGTESGRIIARNVTSGQLSYAVDVGSPFESLGSIHQGRLFLHLRNHSIVALDAKTGKILWSYKRAVPFFTTLQRVSVPQGYKDSIIVGFADGYIASISIHDGQVKWERKISQGAKFIDVDLKPALVNGLLWIGTSENNLHILRPSNGAIVRRLKYRITAGPVYRNQVIFLGTAAGEVLALNSKNFTELSRFQTGTGAISSIGMDDELLASTDFKGYLRIFEWQKERGLALQYLRHFGSEHSAFFGRLFFGEKFLALSSSRNRLYMYQIFR
jgi:outer membrane protein assembly factor BamB